MAPSLKKQEAQGQQPSQSSPSQSSPVSLYRAAYHTAVAALLLQWLYRIGHEAYGIRLYAVREFGRVIHEFDPYFNYRATEYLYEHGWYQFRTWFDYKVWYPLGRPVGTTIFPGMQVTVVLLKEFWLTNWSINDICVFVPAWFGVTATLAVAWLTYECTRCNSQTKSFGSIVSNLPGVSVVYEKLVAPLVRRASRAGDHYLALGLSVDRPQSPLVAPASAVAAAAIMSVVPAHLLRSIAGGYDNESIAMTAMCVTFAGWCWALRDTAAGNATENDPHVFALVAGSVTGLAYFYMVAAWGGYVFVLNVIGVHATVLVLLGRYSTKLHRAYTMFYLVGTALAIQVPVVGWTPLKSLEQLGPFLAFGGLQLVEVCEVLRRRRQLSSKRAWMLRVTVFGGAAAAGAVLVLLLAPTGYFGPISSRVRGLFVQHTKTGNPLVDSVAEHQAASPQAYFQYLHDVVYLAPVAFGVTALFFFNDSSSFLIVYATAAYFFSHRMVRLILLTAPIASALGGIFLGRLGVWMLNGAEELLVEYVFAADEAPDDNKSEKTETASTESKKTAGKTGKSTKSSTKKKELEEKEVNGKKDSNSKSGVLRPIILALRSAVSIYLILQSIPYFTAFQAQSHAIAKQISHPTIIQKGQTKSGETVVIDDYREAYFWLRDHTPEDARIMAWWDYGYQITGIANRTTIADGNTWNHEHIALLGRVLTAPEKDAHRIARHMADYVLVWAGGGGDDVAKSPHLRRIANSVYRGLCREPTCREFGFYSDHTPTDGMAASLLYKLHSSGIEPGVEADRNRFQEKFRSKHGKVRIYKIQSVSQESKEWVENNKICDAPGSWFCRGQYPPALKKVLAEKKDFQQLEDFNMKGNGEDDSEYQKEYFDHLLGNKKNPAVNRERAKKAKLTPDQIDLINEEWMDNEMTSMMYQLIASDSFDELSEMLIMSPQLAHIRSEDGRGPMWWAHEFRRPKIIKMLKTLGVSETRTDEHGSSPLDINK